MTHRSVVEAVADQRRPVPLPTYPVTGAGAADLLPRNHPVPQHSGFDEGKPRHLRARARDPGRERPLGGLRPPQGPDPRKIGQQQRMTVAEGRHAQDPAPLDPPRRAGHQPVKPALGRSEEHTSELQSLMRISYAVFCLKKKTNIHTLTLSSDTE